MDGTTFKKIFFLEENSQSNSDVEYITSFPEHIERLKKVIESSKFFMRAIFDKIRYQGKIKIINKLNNNPQHPEYQSSFPDLFVFTPKPNNENSFYPLVRLDEHFNFRGRQQNILQHDQHFQERMEKSVQDSYYKMFSDKHSWQVSDQLKSFQNVKSTIKSFQKNYNQLNSLNELDQNFMKDFCPNLFIINDHLIFSNDRNKMIQDFKKIIPNITSQKLISTYANQKLLNRSYVQLMSENPEINEYQIKNSRNFYTINNLADGSIKLVATNLSDLDVKDKNYIQKYKSLGIRATVIIPVDNLPIIKYSHFIQ